MGIFRSREDRFARQVLNAVRDAGVGHAWYDAEQFAIHVWRDPTDRSPAIAYLGNIFRECRDAGREERRERIARYLSAVVFQPGAPETWDEAAPLLRPLLRAVTFGLGVPAGAPALLRRPALPMLDEVVAVDQPTSMMYVTTRQLEQWGVPASLVFDRAHRNLPWSPSPSPSSAAEAAADGRTAVIRMVDDGDAYCASHLLLDGWLAAQAGRVGGTPVAFVPDTTGLLLTSDAGIGPLFAAVEEEYRDAARPISTMAYTVDAAGAVVPYPAPEGHPLHAVVHRSEILMAAAEYGTQASHLDTDAFAATLTVAERPDRSVFSVATWVEGVDTLLPQADYVSFGSFLVTWDSLTREVDLDPEPGLAPERFRLRTWPHPGVVARLRAAAATP
ncbi:hypothetical protein AB0K00_24730 [Dactylosporangium sp. NPDC049525]|uniref:hypothetical protein n=1 Tax=Dactylosporangium sp. NPDC049525 TaxID=3154730 RepID=UPI003418F6C4